MSDLNKVMLIGRLTREVDSSVTKSGTTVAKFSIANNKTWKDKEGNKQEEVSFFNCTAWGKVGEIIAQYMTKGKQIQITGRLKQNTWDDKDGNKRSAIDVVVEDFQFIGSKNDNSNDNQSDPIPNDPEPNPFSDDDIPF